MISFPSLRSLCDPLRTFLWSRECYCPLLNCRPRGGTAVAVPPPFRPSDPALCGSCPLVTPYYCRLGDLLCFMYVYRYSCLLLSMHVCFVLFPLFDLSFVDFPSVLRYCWLGLLTCKNVSHITYTVLEGT